MFDKFSVGFLMDDRKKKNKELEAQKDKKRLNSTLTTREALSDEITIALINFGKSFTFTKALTSSKLLPHIKYINLTLLIMLFKS